MALFKAFGDHRNDQGEEITFGPDPEHGERIVSFRIRRLPEGKGRKIASEYGREEKVQLEHEGKIAVTMQRVHNGDDMLQIILDRGCYSWIDSKNFFITPGDEEEVKFLRGRLPSSETIEIGQEVCLDGRFAGKEGDSLKRYLLTQFPPLRQWINEQSMALENEFQKVQGQKRGN